MARQLNKTYQNKLVTEFECIVTISEIHFIHNIIATMYPNTVTI